MQSNPARCLPQLPLSCIRVILDFVVVVPFDESRVVRPVEYQSTSNFHDNDRSRTVFAWDGGSSGRPPQRTYDIGHGTPSFVVKGFTGKLDGFSVPVFIIPDYDELKDLLDKRSFCYRALVAKYISANDWNLCHVCRSRAGNSRVFLKSRIFRLSRSYVFKYTRIIHTYFFLLRDTSFASFQKIKYSHVAYNYNFR